MSNRNIFLFLLLSFLLFSAIAIFSCGILNPESEPEVTITGCNTIEVDGHDLDYISFGATSFKIVGKDSKGSFTYYIELTWNNQSCIESAKAYTGPLAIQSSLPGPVTIQFAIMKAEHVVITIHNTSGQKLLTLVDEPKNAGYHQVDWDGRDDKGKLVSGGVYYYTLQVGSDFVETKMIILIQ